MSVPCSLIMHNYVAQGEAAGPEFEDATKQSEQKEVCFTEYTEHTNVYVTAFGVHELLISCPIMAISMHGPHLKAEEGRNT